MCRCVIIWVVRLQQTGIRLAISVAVVVWAVAEDYQIKKVHLRPIESYPARLTIRNVTVAAEPYPTDEKSSTAFDVKNMNSKGYFPLHIIIKNTSPNPLSVRTRDIVLVLSAGQELYTTPATLVVQDLLKGKATSTKAGSPLLDFTGKELTNMTVEPETVANGFVFFFAQGAKKSFFSGSVLRIPQITDEGAQKPLGPFLIPLDPGLANTSEKN